MNNSEPKPRKKLTLKPWRPTANIPGEFREAIERRVQHLKYDGFAEYLLSLVIYDLWSNREHLLTGPMMREPKFIRETILLEVIALLEGGETEGKKPGGWFEKRIDELVAAAREAMEKKG